MPRRLRQSAREPRRRSGLPTPLEVEPVGERGREVPRVARLLAAEPDRAESPRPRARGSRSAGVPGQRAPSRSNAALADASDTCCSKIRWTSVANEGSRAHSGGGPNRSTEAPSAGSAAARARVSRNSERTGERDLSSASCLALSMPGRHRARLSMNESVPARACSYSSSERCPPVWLSTISVFLPCAGEGGRVPLVLVARLRRRGPSPTDRASRSRGRHPASRSGGPRAVSIMPFQRPPGRTSSSTSRISLASVPNQIANCSGSVQASKTTSGGASKVRLIV